MDTATFIGVLSLTVAIITAIITLEKGRKWADSQIERLPITASLIKRRGFDFLRFITLAIHRFFQAVAFTSVISLPLFSCFFIYLLINIIAFGKAPPDTSLFFPGDEIKAITATLLTMLAFVVIIGYYLYSLYNRVSRLEFLFKLPSVQRIIEESNQSLTQLAKDNWHDFIEYVGRDKEMGQALSNCYPISCNIDKLTIGCTIPTLVRRVNGDLGTHNGRNAFRERIIFMTQSFPPFEKRFRIIECVFMSNSTADFADMVRANKNKDVLFFDDFEKDSLNTEDWKIFKNDGEIRVKDGSLFLECKTNTTSFPYIHTTRRIIPENGNFLIRIGYQFTDVGPHGTGIVICSDLPVNAQENIMDHTYRIWQDSGTSEPVQVKSGTFDMDHHEVEFRWLDTHNEIYIDGNLKGTYTKDSTKARPTSIWVGNYFRTDVPYKWTNFKVDYIEVRRIP